MAEATDGGTEEKQEETSGDTSERDLAADAKHFQSLADKRDAENKSLKEERDAFKAERDTIKAAQDKTEREALEKNNEFKTLYEKSQVELEASTKARDTLALQVELHSYLAEKHPEFVPDSRWILPHVTSKEDIASVVEDYAKAHPKAPGIGAAGMGNTGKDGEGMKTISQADLNDPAKLNKLLDEDSKLSEKIASGEIKLI